MLLPQDAEERREYPVGTFMRDYFPYALTMLAHHSFIANEQHNPGQPMHWAKDKSIGDGNQLMRHFLEGDKIATAWRAVEAVERECWRLVACNVPRDKWLPILRGEYGTSELEVTQ